MSHNENSQDESWGWDNFGSEEDLHTDHQQPPPVVVVEAVPAKAPVRGSNTSNDSLHMRKSNSERSFNSRNKHHHSNNALKGIVSSPSFNELERAIGVALMQSSNSDEALSSQGSTQFGHHRVSSTNLMQQKVHQHRMRQQQQHPQYYSAYPPMMQHPFLNGHVYAPPPAMLMAQQMQMPRYAQPGGGNTAPSTLNTASARSELSAFIHESESRALILFHSPSVTQNALREACSQFGVLYYIRPEFHAKGVTFLSYFDLQAAVSAKEGLSAALGAEAEASAFFSVMLHATSNNTEEFKLVIKNLPDTANEGEVQSIFARYGPLRSIQKFFGSESNLQSLVQNGSPTAGTSASYTVEYFNIQDARLAVCELSATSSSLFECAETTVKCAPLDERKQQLCKQLLSTMSRWRSEMAANNANAVASMHNAGNPAGNIPPPLPMPTVLSNGNLQALAMMSGGAVMSPLNMAPPPNMLPQLLPSAAGAMTPGAGMLGFPAAQPPQYMDPNTAMYATTPQQQQQMHQLFAQQQQQFPGFANNPSVSGGFQQRSPTE